MQRVDNYGGDSLYAQLIAVIAAAQDRLWIKVAWWDASPLPRDLLDATIEAAGRVEDVLVVCRPESTNDVVVRELRRAGVRVETKRYIHEKEVLTESSLVSHSMNFTKHEIGRNENSGHVIGDLATLSACEESFRKLLKRGNETPSGTADWVRADRYIPHDWLGFFRYDKLNPLQAEAVPVVLNTDRHVMVVAPTSAGKTLIGEAAVLRSIKGEGHPAVWLVPARALASEVAETVHRWRKLGIGAVELTGETNMASNSVNQADLWVATTEKFEALYRRSSLRDFIAKIGCLVIDEVHLVGDETRGPTLESLIARLRQAHGRTRIVALSATVANAPELASWFNADLVSSDWRPTALTIQFVPYEMPEFAKAAERNERKDSALLPLVRDLQAAKDPEHGVGNILIFCGAKASAERVACQIAQVRWSQDTRTVIESCFENGVGIHYRGAPSAGRALAAFNSKQIRTMVATSGLSSGVNTPSRYVIIRDLELGIAPLETSTAMQMLGRAGRAGKEPEGFGFVMVPHERQAQWIQKLDSGYTVTSRIREHLADALLAEILLGSVTDVTSATGWFHETFAAATGDEDNPEVVSTHLDELLRYGLVHEVGGQLRVTETGALVARLMVDVTSAGRMLTTLPAVPTPTDAAEAEQIVLKLVTGCTEAFLNQPISEKTFEGPVQTILSRFSSPTVAAAELPFRAQFSLAAANLGLYDPSLLIKDKIHDAPGAAFRRAVEEMPRYLAWVAALGYTEAHTWVPAVAGDLTRRLQWWKLSPQPQRGAGRLLWLLEKLNDPETVPARMQKLWARARAAGFRSPDGINSPPREVDVNGDQFTAVITGRAHLELGVPAESPDGLIIAVDEVSTSSRITAVARAGREPIRVTARPPHGGFTLAIPPGAAASRKLAADLFMYTSTGDFTYTTLTAGLELSLESDVRDPLAEARQAIAALTQKVVAAGRRRGLRRLLEGNRRRLLSTVTPLIAPSPDLKAVSVALAEQQSELVWAIAALRRNLARLITIEKVDEPDISPRTCHQVLHSGRASSEEYQYALCALVGALGCEVGIAMGDGVRPWALVYLDQKWQLISGDPSNFRRLDPLIPEMLSPTIKLLQPPAPARLEAVSPRFEWLTEFSEA